MTNGSAEKWKAQVCMPADHTRKVREDQEKNGEKVENKGFCMHAGWMKKWISCVKRSDKMSHAW